MSIFHYISVFVPIVLVTGMPAALKRFNHQEKPYRLYLYLACGLFFISWYLPSPLIDGQNTSFTTHFVGGGLFTGLLWIYLKKALGWQDFWLIEAFSLFALVSALGCINELAELVMVKVSLAKITLTDTNWDILANTLGSLVVYTAYLSKRVAKFTTVLQ